MDVRVSGASILGEKQSLDPQYGCRTRSPMGPENLKAALHMRYVRGAFKALAVRK
jgi:hypothetical protein